MTPPTLSSLANNPELTGVIVTLLALLAEWIRRRLEKRRNSSRPPPPTASMAPPTNPRTRKLERPDDGSPPSQ